MAPSSIAKDMSTTNVNVNAALFDSPRSLYHSPLSVRFGRIEDHDDLHPILHRQTQILTDSYGDFYLAHLLEKSQTNNQNRRDNGNMNHSSNNAISHDESASSTASHLSAHPTPASASASSSVSASSSSSPDVVLVADVADRAVGLLCLSMECDVSLLQSSFDLSAYDGFKKHVTLEEQQEIERRNRPDMEQVRREQESVKANKQQARVNRLFQTLVDMNIRANENANANASNQSDPAPGQVDDATSSTADESAAKELQTPTKAKANARAATAGANANAHTIAESNSCRPVSGQKQPAMAALTAGASAASDHLVTGSSHVIIRTQLLDYLFAHQSILCGGEDEKVPVLVTQCLNKISSSTSALTLTSFTQVLTDYCSAWIKAEDPGLRDMSDLLHWFETVALPEEERRALTQATLAIEERERAEHRSQQATREAAAEAERTRDTSADNVMICTLFAMDEQHMSRSFAFLPAAFQCYPQADYCVLTLPHTSPVPDMIQRYFNKVEQKPYQAQAQAQTHSSSHTHSINETNRITSHCLYVMHRSTCLSIMNPHQLTLNWSNVADVDSLRQMIHQIENDRSFAESITSRVVHSVNQRNKLSRSANVDGLTHACMDIRVGGELVGLVLAESQSVSQLQNIATLYDIDAYALHDVFASDFNNNLALQSSTPNSTSTSGTSSAAASLTYMALNPLFRVQTMSIYRQLMRLYCKQLLFYRFESPHSFITSLSSADGSAASTMPSTTSPSSSASSLTSIHPELLQDFWPVRRRRLPQSTPTSTAADDVSLKSSKADSQLTGSTSFALQMMCRSLLPLDVHVSNARICVIGRSETSTLLLNELLMQSKTRYNHMTLIDETPINAPSTSASPIDSFHFMPHDLPCSVSNLSTPWHVSALHHINVKVAFIHGSIDSFDCHEQTINVSSSTIGTSAPLPSSSSFIQLHYDYIVMLTGKQATLPLEMMYKPKPVMTEHMGQDANPIDDAKAEANASAEAKSKRKANAAHVHGAASASTSASATLVQKSTHLLDSTLKPSTLTSTLIRSRAHTRHQSQAFPQTIANDKQQKAQSVNDAQSHPHWQSNSSAESSSHSLNRHGRLALSSVFAVSSLSQLHILRHHLSTIHSNAYCVYGRTLTALSIIRVILESGAKPQQITWIYPKHKNEETLNQHQSSSPSSSLNQYVNGVDQVHDLIVSELKHIGIHLYAHHRIVGVEPDADSDYQVGENDHCIADNANAKINHLNTELNSSSAHSVSVSHVGSGSDTASGANTHRQHARLANRASASNRIASLTLANDDHELNAALISESQSDSAAAASSNIDADHHLIRISCDCLINTLDQMIDDRILQSMQRNSIVINQSCAIVDDTYATVSTTSHRHAHAHANNQTEQDAGSDSAATRRLNRTFFVGGPMARLSNAYASFRSLQLDAFAPDEQAKHMAQSLMQQIHLNQTEAQSESESATLSPNHGSTMTSKLASELGSMSASASASRSVSLSLQLHLPRSLPRLGQQPKSVTALLPNHLYYFEAHLPSKHPQPQPPTLASVSTSASASVFEFVTRSSDSMKTKADADTDTDSTQQKSQTNKQSESDSQKPNQKQTPASASASDQSKLIVQSKSNSNLNSNRHSHVVNGSHYAGPHLYMRLAVNAFSMIESITYIGRVPCHSVNLVHLCGLSISYLNRFTQRFVRGDIVDLASYLQQAQIMPLYHESFSRWRQERLQQMARDRVHERHRELESKSKPTSQTPHVTTIKDSKVSHHLHEQTHSNRSTPHHQLNMNAQAVASQIKDLHRQSTNESHGLAHAQTIADAASSLEPQSKHQVQLTLLEFVQRNQTHLPQLMCT